MKLNEIAQISAGFYYFQADSKRNIQLIQIVSSGENDIVVWKMGEGGFVRFRDFQSRYPEGQIEPIPEHKFLWLPEIEVQSDYDGYFKNIVQGWITKKHINKQTFKNKKIVITAGPWRSCAVSARKIDDNTLHLDFYAAIRAGFGYLDDREVEDIIENWL